MRDGDIDYSNYSIRELEEAFAGINKHHYPNNYHNLCAARAARGLSTPADPIAVSDNRNRAIALEDRMPNVFFAYCSWKGRISRKTFWIYGIVPSALYLLLEYAFNSHGPIFWLAILVTAIPASMLNIKRSHDRDRSGWFTILLLVPILNLWPTIELGFLPGNEGSNRFGSPYIW